MIEKIYVDMDGVLSDFEKRVSEILDIQTENIKSVKSNKIWSAINYYDKRVEPFFETLPIIHDASILWNYLMDNFNHVEILTATGFTPKNASEQKEKWVQKHLSGYKKINTVTRSADKARFASPTSILIDDRVQSINPWIDAGGIGILHKSAIDTIKQLKELLENKK